MKNLLIMLLVACVFSTRAQDTTKIKGNLFQDATDLKKLIAEKKIAEALQIIQYYTRDVNGEMITNPDSIVARLKKNPLLDSLLPENFLGLVTADERSSLFKKKFKVTEGGADVQGGGLESIFPASTIADGLGTFIAERFKEELTMRYLENFRRKLVEGDEKFFYSKLLPKTYQALQSYPNVFDYKAFLTVLREAFKDDLDQIDQNILPFIDLNLTAQMDSSEFFIGLATFDLFLNKIPQSVNALEAVAGLRQNEYFIKVNDESTVKKAFILTSLLTETLKNNKGYLDSKTDFGIFIREFRDAQYGACFFGLFIQQHYNTLQNISFPNTNLVETISDNFGKYQRVAGHLIAMHVALQNYRVSDVVEREKILTLLTSLNTELKKLADELDAFLPEDVVEDIRNVLGISERFLAMSKFAIEEKYGLVIIEILKTIEDTNLRDTNPMLYEGLNTYGLFIANVAQAKSGQEVKEALDVAALPVGSYMIKRNSLFDISFNAYPGVALGMEFRSGIPTTAEEEVEKSIASIAFAVPVGIGLSWGSMKETTTPITKEQKRVTSNQNEFKIKETVKIENKDTIITRTVRSITGSSHSVFVSIFDIGAITAFRLTDEETEKLPEFTWENILAPGLFYFYGFKNTPLSLGIGVQYGPQLRTLTDSDVKIADSLVSARILLSVDVPIFNFFSRTGVKKKNQTDPHAFYK